MADPSQKILSLEQADAWVERQRAAGLRIGFTCGSFDLLHAGHVHYLTEARRLCDRLLVAVNSDESVRRYKSPLRPFHPERQRMYVVAGLAAVDAVTVLEDDRPLSLLLRWKPDLYIKGGDYASGSLRSAEAVEAYGGKVALIQPEFASSTSGLAERIVAASVHAPPAAVGTGHCGLALLDRDGTLIRNIPFLHDPGQVELLPGVIEGLKLLQDAGLALAIVTNQQGIGLGYYNVQQFIDVNQKLLGLLGPHGIAISKVYFCPHSLAENCECRKPSPAMLLRAMREFGTTPETTFLIGDSAADMQAGNKIGCRTVRSGSQGEEDNSYSADGFLPAAEWVAAAAKKLT